MTIDVLTPSLTLSSLFSLITGHHYCTADFGICHISLPRSSISRRPSLHSKIGRERDNG